METIILLFSYKAGRAGISSDFDLSIGVYVYISVSVWLCVCVCVRAFVCVSVVVGRTDGYSLSSVGVVIWLVAAPASWCDQQLPCLLRLYFLYFSSRRIFVVIPFSATCDGFRVCAMCYPLGLHGFVALPVLPTLTCQSLILRWRATNTQFLCMTPTRQAGTQLLA